MYSDGWLDRSLHLLSSCRNEEIGQPPLYPPVREQQTRSRQTRLSQLNQTYIVSPRENETQKLLKVTVVTTGLSVRLFFIPPCPLSPLADTKLMWKCTWKVSKFAFFFKKFVFACLFSQPFGVNQPGPYVMYTTVDSNGDMKNASGKCFLFEMSCHGSMYTLC